MISPQGYIYGEDPKATNPFWNDNKIIVDQYVKEVSGTVTTDEAEGYNTFQPYYINQDNEKLEVSPPVDYLTPTQVDTKIQDAKNEIQSEIPTEYIKDLDVQTRTIQAPVGPYTKLDFYKTLNGQEQSLINSIQIYKTDQISRPVRASLAGHPASITTSDDVEVTQSGTLTASTKRFNKTDWTTLGRETDETEITTLKYAKPENIVSYVEEKLGAIYPHVKSIVGFSASNDNYLTEQINLQYTQKQSPTSTDNIQLFSWTNYTKEGIQDLINKTINGKVAQITASETTKTRDSGLIETHLTLKVYAYIDGKPSIAYTPIEIVYVKPVDLEAYIDSKLGGT